MKACPYCAEPIQSAAILCRHCGSDLDSVAYARRRDVGAGATDGEPPHARLRRPQAALAVALASTVTTLPSMLLLVLINTGVIEFPSDATLDLILFGSLLPVVLCGLWTSLAWPGKHLLAYLGLGALAGLIDLFVVGGLIGGLLPVGPVAEWISFDHKEVVSSGGLAALFAAGAILGDITKRPRTAHGARRASTVAHSGRHAVAVKLLEVATTSALGVAGTFLTSVLGSPLK